jgi:hypothetical protein
MICSINFKRNRIRLLFVPITTIAIYFIWEKYWWRSCIYRYDATIRGSFGIAIITTLSRASVRHRVNLVAHLDGTKFEVQQRLQLLQKDLCQKDLPQMKQWKSIAIDYSVMKQSTVLSYMDIFLYLGILFLCCIPIIFLIKKGKQNQSCRCDETIKNSDLHRSFFIFFYGRNYLVNTKWLPADRVASNW